MPTGPWLSTVYHVRACNRYYGLLRRSDELRPAWASSAYSGRSLPLRAVRLTFPALSAVHGRACPSRGLPQPESAITTRLNHLLPRRDSHPLACQGSKAAHRIMAGQNHVPEGPRSSKSRALERAHSLSYGGLLLMILSTPALRGRGKCPEALGTKELPLRTLRN